MVANAKRFKHLVSWCVAILLSCVAVLLSVAGLGAAARESRLANAVEKQDRESVRVLLSQRVDVNAPQADGATALHWAAHWNDVETTDLLIRRGANVNAVNDYGITPLSLACTNGNPAIAVRLLQAGANANAALSTGETPFMTAARTGSVEIVTALTAHGADVNAKERTHAQTALMWAAAQGHSRVVRTLIESGSDIRARSTNGFTPLLFAARQGDVESIRALIGAGADVDETALDGSSALLVATASGQEAAALLLLEKGADPNRADSIGYTPLHAVVWKPSAKAGLTRANGTSALVDALLAHGADPDARIRSDPPPVPGSYFFQTGLEGATPYWLAARAADTSVMQTLAAGGADLQLRNKAGTTPLMVASGLGQTEGPGGTPETRLLESVKTAIELDADVNATNEAGQTAVHGAAGVGFDTIIQYLADHGASVSVKDKRGQTPFSSAQRRNAVHTMDLLRKLGSGQSGDGGDQNRN
jgi:ankyrin repeat protein